MNPSTFPETQDEPTDLQALRIGGTEVHYYVLCPRKLWWYAHGLEQEHAGGASQSVGQENVALGTLLHETAYQDKHKKDLLIDDLLRLDFTESGTVHEIKKSRGAQKATQFQLLYYLYYLKHEKGIVTTGVIDYPKERKREKIELTTDLEAQVAELIAGLQATRSQSTPPFVSEPMPLCRKCSYQELCWG